jgi:hypothetical protein
LTANRTSPNQPMAAGWSSWRNVAIVARGNLLGRFQSAPRSICAVVPGD